MDDLAKELKEVKEMIVDLHAKQIELSKLLLEKGLLTDTIVQVTDPQLLAEERQIISEANKSFSDLTGAGTSGGEAVCELEAVQSVVSDLKKRCSTKNRIVMALLKGLKSNVPRENWEKLIEYMFDENRKAADFDSDMVAEFLREAKILPGSIESLFKEAELGVVAPTASDILGQRLLFVDQQIGMLSTQNDKNLKSLNELAELLKQIEEEKAKLKEITAGASGSKGMKLNFNIQITDGEISFPGMPSGEAKTEDATEVHAEDKVDGGGATEGNGKGAAEGDEKGAKEGDGKGAKEGDGGGATKGDEEGAAEGTKEGMTEAPKESEKHGGEVRDKSEGEGRLVVGEGKGVANKESERGEVPLESELHKQVKAMGNAIDEIKEKNDALEKGVMEFQNELRNMREDFSGTRGKMEAMLKEEGVSAPAPAVEKGQPRRPTAADEGVSESFNITAVEFDGGEEGGFSGVEEPGGRGGGMPPIPGSQGRGSVKSRGGPGGGGGTCPTCNRPLSAGRNRVCTQCAAASAAPTACTCKQAKTCPGCSGEAAVSRPAPGCACGHKHPECRCCECQENVDLCQLCQSPLLESGLCASCARPDDVDDMLGRLGFLHSEMQSMEMTDDILEAGLQKLEEMSERNAEILQELEDTIRQISGHPLTEEEIQDISGPPVEGTTKDISGPPVEGTTKDITGPPVEGTAKDISGPPVEGTTKDISGPPVEGTTKDISGPPVDGTTKDISGPPVEGTTKDISGPPVEGTAGDISGPPVEDEEEGEEFHDAVEEPTVHGDGYGGRLFNIENKLGALQSENDQVMSLLDTLSGELRSCLDDTRALTAGMGSGKPGGGPVQLKITLNQGNLSIEQVPCAAEDAGKPVCAEQQSEGFSMTICISKHEGRAATAKVPESERLIVEERSTTEGMQEDGEFAMEARLTMVEYVEEEQETAHMLGASFEEPGTDMESRVVELEDESAEQSAEEGEVRQQAEAVVPQEEGQRTSMTPETGRTLSQTLGARGEEPYQAAAEASPGVEHAAVDQTEAMVGATAAQGDGAPPPVGRTSFVGGPTATGYTAMEVPAKALSQVVVVAPRTEAELDRTARGSAAPIVDHTANVVMEVPVKEPDRIIVETTEPEPPVRIEVPVKTADGAFEETAELAPSVGVAAPEMAAGGGFEEAAELAPSVGVAAPEMAAGGGFEEAAELAPSAGVEAPEMAAGEGFEEAAELAPSVGGEAPEMVSEGGFDETAEAEAPVGLERALEMIQQLEANVMTPNVDEALDLLPQLESELRKLVSGEDFEVKTEVSQMQELEVLTPEGISITEDVEGEHVQAEELMKLIDELEVKVDEMEDAVGEEELGSQTEEETEETEQKTGEGEHVETDDGTEEETEMEDALGEVEEGEEGKMESGKSEDGEAKGESEEMVGEDMGEDKGDMDEDEGGKAGGAEQKTEDEEWATGEMEETLEKTEGGTVDALAKERPKMAEPVISEKEKPKMAAPVIPKQEKPKVTEPVLSEEERRKLEESSQELGRLMKENDESMKFLHSLVGQSKQREKELVVIRQDLTNVLEELSEFAADRKLGAGEQPQRTVITILKEMKAKSPCVCQTKDRPPCPSPCPQSAPPPPPPCKPPAPPVPNPFTDCQPPRPVVPIFSPGAKVSLHTLMQEVEGLQSRTKERVESVKKLCGKSGMEAKKLPLPEQPCVPCQSAACSKFTKMERVGCSTLLLAWERPFTGPPIVGYELLVNGRVHHKVRSSGRTKAMLYSVDPETPMKIGLRGVTQDGCTVDLACANYPPC